MYDALESVVVAMWTCVGGVCLFMEEVEASPPKVIERNCTFSPTASVSPVCFFLTPHIIFRMSARLARAGTAQKAR
jgi:hypothetical protein